VSDEAIHVNTRQGDVCDEHFHGMSDVKNNLPLYSVLNKDQAELNAAAAPTDSSEWLQHKIERQRETAKQEVVDGAGDLQLNNGYVYEKIA